MKITVGVDVITSTEDELVRALRELTGQELLVGVPDSKAGRDDGSPINNADIAYLMNNGSPTQNIPARPTMVPGITDVKEDIVSILRTTGEEVLSGGSVTAGYTAAGLVAVNAIKHRITDDTPPPLSDATIAARERRGVTRTNTLVDTGKYLNAHTSVIRKKTQP